MTTKNYEDIILGNRALLDVRAPIEFSKGAFPGSVNVPILNDKERHLIGITYKEEGNAKATQLGYELVSGDIKESRVQAWLSFFKENPDGYLYCFRGGSRSRIAQEWLKEAGLSVLRLEGGYKAFRNYLLDQLTQPSFTKKPIILSGHTGNGKTILLRKTNKTIDLEAMANHRGSSFGHFITPQPSQIDFEHLLAYGLIQYEHGPNQHFVIEDEGRHVGRCFIPQETVNWFNTGSVIELLATEEERVENTLKEYVIDSQANYLETFGQEEGHDKWLTFITDAIKRLERRLGGLRMQQLLDEVTRASDHQRLTGSYTSHEGWIRTLLIDYYDPMYTYQMEKSTRPVIFKGYHDEVLDFIQNLS